MALLVPNDNAYMSYILPDFLKIVGGDTSVGDSKTPDPAWISIEYNHNQPGVSQAQFFSIVHGTANFNILLRYVQSDFELPEDPDPQTGHITRIAEVQGSTYAPGSGNANPLGSGVILIYLDAYNDNSANYWVRGQDGTKIFSPRWVQLFHELSHALHIARGEVTDATPEAQENAYTIGDENKLRAQYQPQHQWLKQRNLNEEGGSGAPDPEPAFNNPSPKSLCPSLIVSVASGSPKSRQVRRLERLRGSLLRDSVLADEFLKRLSFSYLRFAPFIANDMKESPALKRSIAKLVVEPLVEVFVLLKIYVRQGGQQTTFASRVQRSLARYLRGFGESNDGVNQIDFALREVKRLATFLDNGAELTGTSGLSPEPTTSSISEVMDYIGRTVKVHGGNAEILRWTIAIPLVIYWSALALIAENRTSASDVALSMGNAMEEWLIQSPIAPLLETLGENGIQNSLRQLSGTVFTIPSVRQKLSLRLLQSHSHLVSFDLRAALVKSGYLTA